MTCPPLPPYYSIDVFNHIRAVKEEVLLNLKTMSSAIWYRVHVLLEENVLEVNSAHVELKEIILVLIGRDLGPWLQLLGCLLST